MLAPAPICCQLRLASWTSDRADPWPVAVIDAARSQSFVVLDGGITRSGGETALAYRPPDAWTWALFRQLVGRLRRHRFNDLDGVINDSLRDLGRSAPAHLQGSATFIAGSTIPHQLGTDRFLILDLRALSDGCAVLLRPCGPQAGAGFAPDAASDVPDPGDGVQVQVERLKAALLRDRIRAAAAAAANRNALSLRIEFDQKRLDEMQFRLALIAIASPDERRDRICQRRASLDRLLIVGESRRIVDAIVAGVVAGRAAALAVGAEHDRRLRGLRAFRDAWAGAVAPNPIDRLPDATVFDAGDEIAGERRTPSPEPVATTTSMDGADTLAGLKAMLDDAYAVDDASRQAGQPLARTASAPRAPCVVQPTPRGDVYEALFVRLPDDLQRQIQARNQAAGKVVRFNAHADQIGAHGWSVGVAPIVVDESRRRVLRDAASRYPRAGARRYEPIARTRRLVRDDLTRTGRWYPDIRAYYDDVVETVLGRRPSPAAAAAAAHGGRRPLPWQLMSFRRESCPSQFYQRCAWTLFPGDVVVVGTRALWACTTDQELAGLVDVTYGLDCDRIAGGVIDLALRRRMQFPALFRGTGPLACVVCKVEARPRPYEDQAAADRRRSHRCALL